MLGNTHRCLVRNQFARELDARAVRSQHARYAHVAILEIRNDALLGQMHDLQAVDMKHVTQATKIAVQRRRRRARSNSIEEQETYVLPDLRPIRVDVVSGLRALGVARDAAALNVD